jgi:hypothetical protein
MKQYLLATHYVAGEDMPSEDVMQRMFAQVDAFNKEVMAEGAWVFAGGLLPPENATVVRTDGGTVTMTDGPFAEAKEHLGGFWVIKCNDLDEALDYARRGSVACEGPVEVRPFGDDAKD